MADGVRGVPGAAGREPVDLWIVGPGPEADVQVLPRVGPVAAVDGLLGRLEVGPRRPVAVAPVARPAEQRRQQEQAHDGPPRVPTTNRIYGPEDVNVTPPIVVRQSFAPLADVFAVHAGIVEILVDEVGEVITAKTVVAVNAAYDRLALATARSWRYRPATLDGVAVKYRTIVQLPLKPR